MPCCNFLFCNDIIKKFEKGAKMDSLKEIYINKVITLTNRTYKPNHIHSKLIYELHNMLHKIIKDKGIIKTPSDIIVIRDTIAILADIEHWFEYDGECNYTDDEVVKGAKYILVTKFIL